MNLGEVSRDYEPGKAEVCGACQEGTCEVHANGNGQEEAPPGYRGRRRRPVPGYAIALIVGGMVLFLGGALIVAGAVLAGGDDPGITFCEAIRDDVRESEESGDPLEPMTFQEYQEAREALDSSGYEEIRAPAVELVDTLWQIEQASAQGEPGMEVWPLLTVLTESYSELSGGCAQHGIQLPPLEG